MGQKNMAKNVRKSGIRPRKNGLCTCPLNVINTKHINTVQATGHVTIFDLGARLYTTYTKLYTILKNVQRSFVPHVRQVTPRNQ